MQEFYFSNEFTEQFIDGVLYEMFYLAFEVTRITPESRSPHIDVFIMDKNNMVLFSYLRQEQGLIKVPIVNSKEHKVVFSNFKVNT